MCGINRIVMRDVSVACQVEEVSRRESADWGKEMRVAWDLSRE